MKWRGGDEQLALMADKVETGLNQPGKQVLYELAVIFQNHCE